MCFFLALFYPLVVLFHVYARVYVYVCVCFLLQGCWLQGLGLAQKFVELGCYRKGLRLTEKSRLFLSELIDLRTVVELPQSVLGL